MPQQTQSIGKGLSVFEMMSGFQQDYLGLIERSASQSLATFSRLSETLHQVTKPLRESQAQLVEHQMRFIARQTDVVLEIVRAQIDQSNDTIEQVDHSLIRPSQEAAHQSRSNGEDRSSEPQQNRNQSYDERVPTTQNYEERPNA